MTFCRTIGGDPQSVLKMSYRLFVRMFKAGLQREAFEQLQLLTAVSYPNWTEQSAREQYRAMLLKAAGMETATSDAAAELEAIKGLQALFPTPSPEVLAEIKREQEKKQQ